MNSVNLPSHSHSNNSAFTCVACQIQFPTAQLQRVHMKTEWHRYNLKRRVANLIPVSAQLFQLKILNQREQLEKYDEFGFLIKSSKPKNKHLTKKDLKKLSNRGRFQESDTESVRRDLSPVNSEVSAFSLGTLRSDTEFNYDTDDLRSELSKESDFEIVSSDDDNDDDGTEEEDEEYQEEKPVQLSLLTCFYCGQDNDDKISNINHMFNKHGLYIPDKEYLTNEDGLLRYLADLVSVDRQCIKCGFIGNKLISIRQHIKAKGHAVIPYETKEERALVKQFYDFHNEEVEGEEEEEGEEGEEVEIDNNEELNEYTLARIDKSGVELQLPNGYKLGHRSMSKYYRQNLSRQYREIPDGEKTVSIVNEKSNEILKIRENLKQREEVKHVAMLEGKVRNKNYSNNVLRKGNNLKFYLDQTL